MQPETRLGAMFFTLSSMRPFLATALWRMKRVSVKGLGSFAVDRYWRLYYDPLLVLKWSMETLSAVLYHEVLHLLRDHASRCPVGADPQLWNLAADAEINDDLVQERFPLPDGAIRPGTLGMPPDLLAEEYFEAIKDNQRIRHLAKKHIWSSGSTGHAAEWELPAESGQYGIEEAITPMTAKWIREDIASSIVRGLRPAPEHIWQWANDLLKPSIDWRRELAVQVRKSLSQTSGCVDYSYRTPSRRQSACRDIVMPALCKPVPSIAVVTDTSASMSTEMLDQACSEISGILRSMGLSDGIYVLSVDAAVQNTQRVTRAGSLDLRGGGGTDLRVGLAAATRLRPRPAAVIVITDGMTPWPDEPPAGIRTIVVLLQCSSCAPDWARVIHSYV